MSSTGKAPSQVKKSKSTVQFNGRDEQINREEDNEHDVKEYKSIKSRRATQHLNASKADVKSQISRHRGEGDLTVKTKPRSTPKEEREKTGERSRHTAKLGEVDKAEGDRDRTSTRQMENAGIERTKPVKKQTRKMTREQVNEDDGDSEHEAASQDGNEEEVAESKKGNFGSKLLRQIRPTRKIPQAGKSEGNSGKSEDPMFNLNVKMSAPSLTEAFAPVFVDATSLYLPSRTYNSHKDKEFERHMANLPTGKSGFAAIVESAFGSKVVSSHRKEKLMKKKSTKEVKDDDESESDHSEVDTGEIDLLSEPIRDRLHDLAALARSRAARREQRRGASGGQLTSGLHAKHSSQKPSLALSKEDGRCEGNGAKSSLDATRHERSHHRQAVQHADTTIYKTERRTVEQSDVVKVERDGREVNGAEPKAAHRSHRHHQSTQQHFGDRPSDRERDPSRRHGEHRTGEHSQRRHHHHHHHRHHSREGEETGRNESHRPAPRSRSLAPPGAHRNDGSGSP
jgi:hypothetical protein